MIIILWQKFEGLKSVNFSVWADPHVMPAFPPMAAEFGITEGVRIFSENKKITSNEISW